MNTMLIIGIATEKDGFGRLDINKAEKVKIDKFIGATYELNEKQELCMAIWHGESEKILYPVETIAFISTKIDK